MREFVVSENKVPKTDRRFDAIVAGGGPAALALSLAAAHSGGRVLRLGKDSGSGGRHYALGLRARNFLKNIGAEIPESAVVNRFWLFSGGRKAEVCAEESGLESLCNVVSETALLDSLRKRAKEIPNVAAESDSISDLQSGENGATIRADGKKFRASLIAAADGSRSRLAELSGVGVCARAFGQAALSVLLRAPLPSDVAAQWFGRGDVLALLPVSESDFGAGVFSLIWSLPEDAAQRLAKEGEGGMGGMGGMGGVGGVGGAVARRTGLEGVEVLGELGGRGGSVSVVVGSAGGSGFGAGCFCWRRRKGDSSSGGTGFKLGPARRGGFDLQGFAFFGLGKRFGFVVSRDLAHFADGDTASRDSFFRRMRRGDGDRNINGGKHLPPGPPRGGALRQRLLTLARHLADDAVGEAGGGGNL